MKKFFVLVVALIATIAFSSQVYALSLTYDEDYYLGYIDMQKGNNSSEASEAAYINALILLGPDETGSYSSDGPLLDRANSDLTGPFPDAINWYKNDNGNSTISISGSWDYVAGKYNGHNAGWLVWFVGGEDLGGEVTLPSSWGPGDQTYGLSHTTFFNGITPVPEPATLVLFGFGLIGLAGIGRKKRA